MSEKKWLASDGKTELRPGMLVLAREVESDYWWVNVLSHCDLEGHPSEMYCCIDGRGYPLCLPLAGNESLAGTDNPIPEPRQYATQADKPFEWGERVIVQADNGQTFKGIYVGIEKDAGKFRVILEGCMAVSFWEYCKRA